MQGIKNLIARRRPPSEPLSTNTASAEAADPWDTLQEHVSAEPDLRACDIDSARAARNHIPRPERPQPLPRKEWEPAPAETVDAPGPDLSPTALTPKIWDLEPVAEAPALPVQSAPAPGLSALSRSAVENVHPAGSPPRPASERVKTRLLGFNADAAAPDPMSAQAASGDTTAGEPRFPIGWLVVIDGPGRGASFTLTAGLSTIGRDAGQNISLDFGDTSISRERHAAIAHDDEDNRTYIGHGGKQNIVRQNDKPLLTTEELHHGDTIRIGKTVLRFVSLCVDGFSWTAPEAG